MSSHIPSILQPIIALNGWTFVMEIWMYATRIPVFAKLKEAGDPTTTRAELDTKTPPSVRWKADNYNHLFEQPTQFYAVALALAIARKGEDNPVDTKLAWAYVGIRVLHSFIQSTNNKVMARFMVFLVSSSVLAVLTGRAATLVF
ncbi:membrane-associated, eicosanoid/glutathione metabolism protein [Aspergillus karnatakaensis]|uniref:MAPEG family protein n=1 Tax=Aspergillus karnatakaensis TaxID=1810916 RepID=UPI003CCDC5AD